MIQPKNFLKFRLFRYFRMFRNPSSFHNYVQLALSRYKTQPTVNVLFSVDVHIQPKRVNFVVEITGNPLF